MTKHSGCIFLCVSPHPVERTVFPFWGISFLGYTHRYTYRSIVLQGLQTSYEMVKNFVFLSILLFWGVTVATLR